METPRPPRKAHVALALAAVAIPYAWLAWKLDWLCDDSFISFRYARNLARGAGLVFNPGESPPVEGYTNLLWVLVLAPFEALGPHAPLASRALSVACGFALFAWLGAAVARQVGGDGRLAAAAMLLPATLPPFAAWTTSGLETMPFALAVFGSFASLTGAKPRAALSAACAMAAVLLRADGALFVALALGAVLLAALLQRSRALARAALIAAVAAALVLAIHLLWRHSYYGEWAPNTARVKVALSTALLERGGRYVANFLLSFPAVALALVASLAFAVRRREPTAIASLSVVAGTFAYTAFVGGDFMAMGRFLVPALAFLTLAFARALARAASFGPAGFAGAVLASLACAALSLPAASGRFAVPRSVRESFDFRWSSDVFRSEHEQWQMMREQAQRWSALGRAVARHSQPGQSLILGTIGAVGYHTELLIHDPFGLVNREPFAESTPQERRSPGHTRHVPLERFLALDPTFLEAEFVPRSQPNVQFRRYFGPTGKLFSVAKPELYEIGDVPGAPEGCLLRLMRYAPD